MDDPFVVPGKAGSTHWVMNQNILPKSRAALKKFLHPFKGVNVCSTTRVKFGFIKAFYKHFQNPIKKLEFEHLKRPKALESR